MITEIINNREIEITPIFMYKLILSFAFLSFISGILLGYIITSYYVNDMLFNLISNNGYLIFEDKYYRFIEVIPTIEHLFINNSDYLWN